MEGRTSPKVKIISLKVSETSLATSLGLTPMRCRASLSHTPAPFTNSMVMTRSVDRWWRISGICVPVVDNLSDSHNSHQPCMAMSETKDRRYGKALQWC